MYTIGKMDKTVNQLTNKERAFCEYYCNLGCTAVEAIYEAGFKPKDRKTAYSMGSEYLRKPKILAYINQIFKNFQFSDEEIMHEHWYLIKQHRDLPSKARAIDMYYKKNGMYIQEKPVIPEHRPYEEYSDEELDQMLREGYKKLFPDGL